MRTALFAFVLILASACTVAEATDQKYFTCGLTNGGFWQSAPEFEKYVYLVGFEDALKITKSERMWPAGLGVGDVRRALDQWYEDPLNVMIPVAEAVALITAKSFGAHQEDIDKRVSFIRAYIARGCRAPEPPALSFH